jgi:hypothetical protein
LLIVPVAVNAQGAAPAVEISNFGVVDAKGRAQPSLSVGQRFWAAGVVENHREGSAKVTWSTLIDGKEVGTGAWTLAEGQQAMAASPTRLADAAGTHLLVLTTKEEKGAVLAQRVESYEVRTTETAP